MQTATRNRDFGRIRWLRKSDNSGRNPRPRLLPQTEVEFEFDGRSP
jgi:hypothetical protein